MFNVQNQKINDNALQQTKNRKDFLYKIGKLKENKILNKKEINADYDEQQKESNKIKIEDIQDQLDLQFTPSSHEKNQSMDHNLQDQKYKLNFDNFQNKNSQIFKQKINLIEVQKQKKLQFIKKNQQAFQSQKIVNKNSDIQLKQNMNILNSNFIVKKPFQFDDFQQLTNGQQEIEINQESQQKHMPSHKIKGQDIKNQLQTKNQKKQQIHPQNKKNQINKRIQIFKEQQSDQNQQTSSEQQEQIKGATLTTNSNSLEGNVVIKITNKKQLVSSSLPPGIILKCFIRRSKDIFNPQFDFYLNNGLKHIISAKKYSLAKKQIFKLSLELGQYRTKDIICTVMANTVHNIYWVYRQSLLNSQIQYQTQAVIRYQKIVKNSERLMKVNLFVQNWKKIVGDPKKLGIQIPQQQGVVLKSKQLCSKLASSKNYVLLDQQDKQYQYLKMAKISENMFEVQIQHPLSPLQAFAICLTRFDAQLK